MHIPGYQICRADRDVAEHKRKKNFRGRSSGGVACFIINDLASTMEVLVSFSNGVVEALILYSKLRN